MFDISTVSLFKKDRLNNAMLIWRENLLTAVIISNHYVCEIQLNNEIDGYPAILYYKHISYAGESTVDLLNIWKATIVDRLLSKGHTRNVNDVHAFNLNIIPKEDLEDIYSNWYKGLSEQLSNYCLTTKVVVHMYQETFVIIDNNVPLFVVGTDGNLMLFHNSFDIELLPIHNFRSALRDIICDNFIPSTETLCIGRTHKKLSMNLMQEFSSRYNNGEM